MLDVAIYVLHCSVCIGGYWRFVYELSCICGSLFAYLGGNMHARGVVSMFDAWCFVSVDVAYKPMYVLYLRLAFAALWLGLHAGCTCHR